MPPLELGGGPVAYEVPRHRWVLIAAIAVVAVLLLGGAAFAYWRWGTGPIPGLSGRGHGARSTASSSTTSPAGEATESAEASGSGEATSSEGATKAPVPVPAGEIAAPPREPFVAYRADGAVWVAGEDGTSRRRVADSASGSYALSPDGSRLAVIDGVAKRLTIVDVASGHSYDAGPAEDLQPDWSPDSTFLVFTSFRDGRRSVVRVARDGSVPKVLAAGAAGQVSPDGKSVYLIQASSAGEGGPLVKTGSKRGGSAATIMDQTVYDFTLSPGGVAYVTGVSRRSLWRCELDGSLPVKLLDAPQDQGAYTYARPRISPDGTLLVVDRAGDDGFARMSVLPFSGGSARDLSPRRDDYPVQWTVDGKRILFVTGNADSGEPTDLMSVTPDGSKRDVVVAGAGL